MKTNTLYISLAFLLSLSLIQQAIADDNRSSWENNIELGAVRTAGNTQTMTLNSQLKISHNHKKIRSTVSGSANNASDKNATTAEKYTASIQEDWKITPRDFIFFRGAFESDRFAGFRHRYSETMGYGRELIKSPTFDWRFELGGGLRQSQMTNLTKHNEAIMRSATMMAWQISDSAKLIEELSTEGGKSGWSSKSVTALQHKLNSHLSSKISLKMDHNSKVSGATKKLDVETAITLVVNF